MPDSKKCSLKSAALAVDHHVTTGAAKSPVSYAGAIPGDHNMVQCHTSNMGKIKK